MNRAKEDLAPEALVEALKLCRAELLIRHGLPYGDKQGCKACVALLAADAALRPVERGEEREKGETNG
jgi:hypothetical protein